MTYPHIMWSNILDFITTTDVLSYESKDRVLMEASELLGDQAGDTLDQLCRNILVAGTGVIYSGTSNVATADVAAGDTITLANLDSVIANFKDNKAKRITSKIDASTGFNTTPIRGAYIGLVSPSTGVTIRNLAVTAGTWVPINKYPKQSDVMEGELGSYQDIRFIETTNAKVKTGEGTAGIDVYCSLFLAQNAYGITRVSGEAMKNIIKPLGSAGSADPLDQRATSGWKSTFVALILNQDFIQRIESAKV